MKKLVLLVLMFGFSMMTYAQKTYTVDGNSYELKTELTGTIELLWNVIDNQYRYFAKKGDRIIELKNTKDDNNDYQEEYKQVLEDLTIDWRMSADEVKLTLPSLRDFLYDYNATKNPNYSEDTKKASVQAKLLFFGGVTNSPFVDNPDNSLQPIIGAEIEVYEATNLPRHSLYLQFSQRFKSDELEYSRTQFGLGYRFRIINQERIQFYANILAATYSLSKQTIESTEMPNTTFENSDNAFSAPLIFGVGADIKVSDNSYVSIGYDELFAIDLENSGNFSTHFTVGYKLNL